MPAQSSARSFAASVAGTGITGSGAGASLSSGASAAGSDLPKASVKEAVETVIRIADAQAGQADAQARVVNLGFKIGGENLSVRVELHGNEVRTQFSTDSTELRAALSGEWQGAGLGGGSHDLNFSDPVFASGSGSSGSFSAEGGTDSRRQNDSGAGSQPGWSSPPTDGPGLESAQAATVADSDSLGGSSRLRAFA